MLARIRSATVLGVEAIQVDVEVDITSGLPSFTTVGMPLGAVREGRERIAAALGNSGFQLPLRRITVNLAPADLPKRGPAFDLPIAIGILAASGQLKSATVQSTLLLGELGLEGDLRPVRGVLPIVLAAASFGCDEVILPLANVPEASVVSGLDVRGAATLSEACRQLSGGRELRPVRTDSDALLSTTVGDAADFSDVRSQRAAKRALEVAAAGGHNILLVGPPGSGKTMLARRLPGILPPLTLPEALDVTRVHSVAGILPAGKALVTARPFRAPHHTVSFAGLIGGGSTPRPGEVSLAHHGVLFLDEVAELPRGVLEMLRQPLEDGAVTISRAAMSLSYPSRFLLVAAMNPCPCGHAGDNVRSCSCSPATVQRYLNRVSAPLLDRIDIQLSVPAVGYEDLRGPGDAESSSTVRGRVVAARRRQQLRFSKVRDVHANSHMGPELIDRFVKLSSESEAVLAGAVERLGLSARAYHRVLKLALTLADLAGDDAVGPGHVAEAVQYRLLDRGDGWEAV